MGSPPLAFTFGLGGLAIFPLRFGATATLLENASPANMIEIIETYKATIAFTAPEAEGDYPFVCTLPGHAFSMKGIMKVSKTVAAIVKAAPARVRRVRKLVEERRELNREALDVHRGSSLTAACSVHAAPRPTALAFREPKSARRVPSRESKRPLAAERPEREGRQDPWQLP